MTGVYIKYISCGISLCEPKGGFYPVMQKI